MAAGRSGCINHHCRIVRGGFNRFESGGSAVDQLAEAGRSLPGTVGRDYKFDIVQFVADRRELCHPLVVRDNGLGTGILQAIRQCVDAEESREWQRYCAELVDRDVRHHDFGYLRQQDRDAVAASDAVGAKRIGEAIGGLLQPAVTDLLDLAVREHVYDREPLWIDTRPTIANIGSNVVGRGNLPAKRAIEFVIVGDGWEHTLLSPYQVWSTRRFYLFGGSQSLFFCRPRSW